MTCWASAIRSQASAPLIRVVGGEFFQHVLLGPLGGEEHGVEQAGDAPVIDLAAVLDGEQLVLGAPGVFLAAFCRSC